MIQGKKLAPIGNRAPQPAGITAPGGVGLGSGGAGSGSAIAGEALLYVGHPYVWGGASNPNTGWDCSSFVSWVLGQLGYQIPGGSWSEVTGNGTEHGPVAAQYLFWGGAHNVDRGQVSAGDLLCWQTHVGFAADASQMISAYDTATGTNVTPISAGPTGEVLIVRRVNGVT